MWTANAGFAIASLNITPMTWCVYFVPSVLVSAAEKSNPVCYVSFILHKTNNNASDGWFYEVLLVESGLRVIGSLKINSIYGDIHSRDIALCAFCRSSSCWNAAFRKPSYTRSKSYAAAKRWNSSIPNHSNQHHREHFENNRLDLILCSMTSLLFQVVSNGLCACGPRKTNGGNFQQAKLGWNVWQKQYLKSSLCLTPSNSPITDARWKSLMFMCMCVCGAVRFSVWVGLCSALLCCGVFPSSCCLILIKATENVNQQIFKLAISRFSLPSAIFPQLTTDMTTSSRQLTFGNCVFTCGRVFVWPMVWGWRN